MNAAFDSLYKKAVLKNVVSWDVATNPLSDAQSLEEQLDVEYNDLLLAFIKANPDHPVSKFVGLNTLNSDLIARSSAITNRLSNKYKEMRKTKAPADAEYFQLFEDAIAINKEALAYLGRQPGDAFMFQDPILGKKEQVYNLVRGMAEISREFMKSGRTNPSSTQTTKTFQDGLQYMDAIQGISYKVSDENGSFMTALDRNNSRIHIAKTDKSDFEKLSSVTHEVGHALYQNMFLNKMQLGQLGDCLSLSLHESSSIFNEIALGGFNPEVKLEPVSLFRLGSNKLAYIIHIFIRMEVERMLFEDNMPASDIPQAWNNLVETYIGLTPSNDWEGFLQDVHWNHGMFGYFHSYAIGFLNASLMYSDVKDRLTGDMLHDTMEVVMPKIGQEYGDRFDENSSDLLTTMHPDIDATLARYRNFVFENFSNAK